MTCYSVQTKDRIFLKGYGFVSFAKNIGKNIGKNLSSKYSRNFLTIPNNQPKLKSTSKSAI